MKNVKRQCGDGNKKKKKSLNDDECTEVRMWKIQLRNEMKLDGGIEEVKGKEIDVIWIY